MSIKYIKQEGDPTLGYSEKSGIKIIEVDAL